MPVRPTRRRRHDVRRGCVRSSSTAAGRGQLAVGIGGVQGDDVLEVEQVGVLRGGHERPARVDQYPASPVAVGEHGQDAAQPQQPGRGERDVITNRSLSSGAAGLTGKLVMIRSALPAAASRSAAGATALPHRGRGHLALGPDAGAERAVRSRDQVGPERARPRPVVRAGRSRWITVAVRLSCSTASTARASSVGRRGAGSVVDHSAHAHHIGRRGPTELGCEGRPGQQHDPCAGFAEGVGRWSR